MAESAREFFEKLESRLEPGRLAGTTGSYRFDIEGAGSWRVDVRDGSASVSESDGPADCVIAMTEEVFDKLRAGKQNPVTAVMMGKISIEGDMGLALKLKELF